MPFVSEPLPVAAPRTAVLLLNLGTPDAPTPRAVRRYLIQFLSDPRVVEIPRLLWQLLLRGVIAPLRGRTSARKYALVWTPAGSPLRVHTERQTDGLRRLLAAHGHQVQVDYAMRYGTPSIAEALAQLQRTGVEQVLLLPLYPQYSAATTASAFDAAFAALARIRNQPGIRTVRHYADHPAYIRALAEQVRQYWAAQGRPDFAAGDKLVLSFHGVPKRTIDLGDPYHDHCLETAALLMAALELTPDECRVAFQSRFGKSEWLRPATAATLAELGAAGVSRVDVLCPGFTADCLETLEEIGIEGRDVFLRAGGREFHRIACLNAAPAWLQALSEVAVENLQGWLVRAALVPAPMTE